MADILTGGYVGGPPPASLEDSSPTSPGIACLLAGGAASVALLLLYTLGLACNCCLTFDCLTRELWVDGFAFVTSVRRGPRDGKGLAGFRAVPKPSRFGGTMALVGVCCAIGLCGNVIAFYIAHPGFDQTATIPPTLPSGWSGVTTSLVFTIQTVLLGPGPAPSALGSCAIVSQPLAVGQLFGAGGGALIWGVSGVKSTAAAPDGSGSAQLPACTFTVTLSPVSQGWGFGVQAAAASPAAVTAAVAALDAAALAPGAYAEAAASAALAAVGVGGPGSNVPALLSLALPRGQALTSWSLTVSDGSSGAVLPPSSPLAASVFGVGASAAAAGAPGATTAGGVPLPPLVPPLAPDAAAVPASEASRLAARAHALRLRLMASELTNLLLPAAGGGSGGLTARGYLAGAAGYANASAAPLLGAPLPLASAFSDTLLVSLELSDAGVLRTVRAPRLSVLEVLGILAGLCGGALFGAKLTHDALDAACGCSTLRRNEQRAACAHRARRLRRALYGCVGLDPGPEPTKPLRSYDERAEGARPPPQGALEAYLDDQHRTLAEMLGSDESATAALSGFHQRPVLPPGSKSPPPPQRRGVSTRFAGGLFGLGPLHAAPARSEGGEGGAGASPTRKSSAFARSFRAAAAMVGRFSGRDDSHEDSPSGDAGGGGVNGGATGGGAGSKPPHGFISGPANPLRASSRRLTADANSAGSSPVVTVPPSSQAAAPSALGQWRRADPEPRSVGSEPSPRWDGGAVPGVPVSMSWLGKGSDARNAAAHQREDASVPRRLPVTAPAQPTPGHHGAAAQHYAHE